MHRYFVLIGFIWQGVLNRICEQHMVPVQAYASSIKLKPPGPMTHNDNISHGEGSNLGQLGLHWDCL